jgi:serine/threonine-protein kinase
VTREPPPRRISRYEILGELGRGSMGRVYLAHDPNTDRKVAVKLLALPAGAGAEEEAAARARFLLEARAAARLHHPGIVVVHDAGTDPESDRPFIAMEWVDGRSLSALLAERGPLPCAAAARIAAQVAEALEHAHERGVVHRDVKPGNILLGSDGAVKVSDFGIAKFVAESHTVSGHVLGTPNYISPEQLRGEPVDGRTDLFSLAAVLYEMLTGEPPFRSDSMASITYKVAHLEPRPPSELRADLPGGLERVLLRALAKAPAARWPSAGEFARELAAFAGAPGAAAPALPPERTVVTAAAGAGPPAASAAGAAGAPPPAAASAPPARRRGLEPRAALAAALAALAVVAVALALRIGRQSAHGSPAAGDGSTAAPRPAAAVPASRGAATPAAPAGPPAAAATLEIVHHNRLRGGQISVWVDGERVWSAPLRAPRNVLDRVAGEEVRTRLPVAPGARTIEVRVGHAAARIDASGVVRGQFEPGAQRRLRVVLRPYLPRLGLDWES